MKILVLLSSDSTDFIFFQFIKNLSLQGHELGIFDVASKSRYIIENYYQLPIKDFKELDASRIEYYDFAFCMHQLLFYAQKFTIYVFSLLLNYEEKDIYNPGADLLFFTGGQCIDDSMWVNLCIQPANADNFCNKFKEHDTWYLWIDNSSKISLHKLCAYILDWEKKHPMTNLSIIGSDYEFECIVREKIRKPDFLILYDFLSVLNIPKKDSVIIACSLAAYNQLLAEGYTAILYNLNETVPHIYTLNEQGKNELVLMLGYIYNSFLKKGIFPESKEDINIKSASYCKKISSQNLENLILKRHECYLLSESHLEGLTHYIDIKSIRHSLRTLIGNVSLESKEIYAHWYTIIFTHITMDRTINSLLYDEKNEIVYFIMLKNHLYHSIQELAQIPQSKNLGYYYAQGISAVNSGDYYNSINYLQQYCNLLEKNPSGLSYFLSSKRRISAELNLLISMIEVDVEQINLKEFLHLIQKLSTNKLSIVYKRIVRNGLLRLKRENIIDCNHYINLYEQINSLVGKDPSFNRHKYQICKMKAQIYFYSYKHFSSALYLFRASYYLGRCKLKDFYQRGRKYYAGLKNKYSKFFQRCQKRIHIKIKFLLSFFHIYGHYERKLLLWKNKYWRKRCFIIGNGPSLSIHDLNKLHAHHEYTFACNKIYKIFNQTDWRPDFYACTDSTVFGQNYYSILNIGNYQKFLGANLPKQDLIRKNPQNIILNYASKRIEKTKFNPLATFIFSGGTVTFVLITLAWMMGFREIYLIGCDHSYGFFEDKKYGSATSTSQTNNDYFMCNYMRPGEKINIGNLDRSKQGYKLARDYIESHGGKIYNATRGGKLEVFVRANFDDLFNAID